MIVLDLVMNCNYNQNRIRNKKRQVVCIDDEFDQIWKEDEWFQAWYWEVGVITNIYKHNDIHDDLRGIG